MKSELERKVAGHDGSIKALFEAIRQLMALPNPGRRPIGFADAEGWERVLIRLRKPPF